MLEIDPGTKGAGFGPPSSWTAAVVALLILVIVGVAAPAAAKNSPVFAGPPIDFYGGTKILGGLTTEPDGTTISLTPGSALAFMESWFPDSVAGHPTRQTPPARVKRGTVVVGVLDIDRKTKIAAKVFYAVDGATAWVGMPAQTLWAGAAVTKESWIVASFPDKLIAAAEGKVAPYVAPPPPTASPAAPAAAPVSKSSSSSTGWIWIVGGIAVVVVLLALAAVLRSRRSAGDKQPAPTS